MLRSEHWATGRRLCLALLTCAGLWMAPTAMAEAGAPDTILINGYVITLAPSAETADSVAIRAGTISAVGRKADLIKLAGPGTAIVDLKGKTVIPGLIDSHSHFLRAGLHYSESVDISAATTVADALAIIGAATGLTPPGEWIVVHGGWHSNQFAERRPPSPAELDEVAPDNPVFLLQGYELLLLNRPALAKLNITSAASLPAPMKVEVDANGKPTGVVLTTGSSIKVNQMLAAIRGPDNQAHAARNTKVFFQALNRVGLTGFIDDGGLAGPGQYEPVKELWRKGELTVRVRYNLFSLKAGQESDDLQSLLATVRPEPEDAWLRWMGVGELMTGGMYFSSTNENPQPPTSETKQRAAEFALWVAKRGYTLDVHAPTDLAASAILDVYEEVDRQVDIGPLRWRLSHCETCSDRTLERMRALGVSLLVQNALYFDTDGFVKRYDATTVRRAPPIMSAARLGVRVAAGSDATVVSPYNPFVGLGWLVTGKTLSGATTRAPSELVPRLDALRMYTTENAWLSFEESQRGSIEVGKLADIVVLDRNYLTVPADEIQAIKPVATIVGGKFVYHDPRALDLPARRR